MALFHLTGNHKVDPMCHTINTLPIAATIGTADPQMLPACALLQRDAKQERGGLLVAHF